VAVKKNDDIAFRSIATCLLRSNEATSLVVPDQADWQTRTWLEASTKKAEWLGKRQGKRRDASVINNDDFLQAMRLRVPPDRIDGLLSKGAFEGTGKDHAQSFNVVACLYLQERSYN